MPTDEEFTAAQAHLDGLIARCDAALASCAETTALIEADRTEAARLRESWGLAA